jgi:hypothetical protein
MRIQKALPLFFLIAALAIPAQAFTFNTLSIDVQENGDCIADFDYSMTFWEYIGYYTKIASPTDKIREELDKRTSVPVDILEVTDKYASFKIYNYATVTDNNGAITYTVPSLNFSKAEEALKDHWVSKITSFDLSPEETSIIFPDGYTKTYYNQADLPQTVHTV